MLAPVSCGGTNSALRATAMLTALRKRSVGGAGMAMKDAECCMRWALSSGRKRWIEALPGERKALRPS